MGLMQGGYLPKAVSTERFYMISSSNRKPHDACMCLAGCSVAVLQKSCMDVHHVKTEAQSRQEDGIEGQQQQQLQQSQAS